MKGGGRIGKFITQQIAQSHSAKCAALREKIALHLHGAWYMARELDDKEVLSAIEQAIDRVELADQ